MEHNSMKTKYYYRNYYNWLNKCVFYKCIYINIWYVCIQIESLTIITLILNWNFAFIQILIVRIIVYRFSIN